MIKNKIGHYGNNAVLPDKTGKPITTELQEGSAVPVPKLLSTVEPKVLKLEKAKSVTELATKAHEEKRFEVECFGILERKKEKIGLEEFHCNKDVELKKKSQFRKRKKVRF